MDCKHQVGKVLAPFFVLLAIASCSTDNTTTEATSYCAVTNVTLGSQKCVKHTTAQDGSDSTYTVSISGSYYPMYIDQVNGLIYNGDSLPYGTDQQHIVLSNLDCEGVLAMRTASGQDSAFSVSSSTSSPDSIDFTKPRTIVVYAYDGLNKKEYTMSVNVHQEDGDLFPWRAKGSEFDLAAMDSTRAVYAADQYWVFGIRTTDGKACTMHSADGENWTTTPLTGTSHFNPRSLQVTTDNRFYALDGTRLMSSSNGTDWAPVGNTQPLSHLLACVDNRFYAIAGGEFVCSTDGISWTRQERDTDGSLPTEEVVAVQMESRLYNHFIDLTVTGHSGDSTVVWYKQIDTQYNHSYPWTYMPRTNENVFPLPYLKSQQSVAYDNRIMTIGLTPQGTLSNIYTSADNGRTWFSGEEYVGPANAQASNQVAMLCTPDHFVWLFCGGSGQIWRGRLNRMGWTENQTSFTRTAH